METVEKPVVVVANSPRVYREAISGAIYRLRPKLEVVCIEPENLPNRCRDLGKKILVISDLPLESFKCTDVPTVWITLYYKGKNSIFYLNGKVQSYYEDITLGDFLEILDNIIYRIESP